MVGRLVSRLLFAAGFDHRTVMYLKLDLRRLYVRMLNHRRELRQSLNKLHLGAGNRVVQGWLNCDIVGSDHDVDLAAGKLPFASTQFRVIVAQHLIEHLEFDPTLIHLLGECYRILEEGGEIWLSCPDMEKVCSAYVTDRGGTLDEGRKRHSPLWRSAPGFPVQHRINYLFHQRGEHRNLLDFDMLDWALRYVGFAKPQRMQEHDFLASYPEFPARRDEETSILVKAVKHGERPF